MDYFAPSWIILTLSFVPVFIFWIFKNNFQSANKDGNQQKHIGYKEYIMVLYSFLKTPGTVDGQSISKFQNVYDKFVSVKSKYFREQHLVSVFGIPIVFFATDYKTILEIHRSDAFNDRGLEYTSSLYGGGKLGGILMNSGNGHWSEMKKFTLRKLGQLGLGKKNIMSPFLSEQLPELLDRIEKRRQVTGNKIQAKGLFSVAVLNVTISVIIGKTFLNDDPDFVRIFEAIHFLTDMHFLRIFFLDFLKNIPGGPKIFGYSKFLEMVAQLRGVCMKIINEREMLLANNENSVSLVDVFLGEITKHKDDPVFCKEQLATLTQDLFITGMDTTGNFLDSLVMFMCLYPEIQKKVQQEIDSVMGTSAIAVNHECKAKLPYTMAVFYEVHRMAPVLPIMPRTATRDVTIGGHFLKKGTPAMSPIFILRNDETYFENPFQFLPERFIGEDGCIIQEKANLLLIFGAGPRVCPAENFAPTMAFTFGAGFLQKYFVKRYDDSEVLRIKDCGIVTGPEPFHVSVFER